MNGSTADIMDAPSELRVILVRAGATELDAQGRITGALDVPMCEEAEQHVERSAAQLSFVPIDAIYSSSCDSAKQTAMLLARDRKLKVRFSPDLTNLDCGLWHGKRLDEVRQTQPRLFRKWAEMSEDACPPNGETLAEARVRVGQFLARLRKKHTTGTVVIVAPQPLLSVIRGEVDPSATLEPWPTVSSSGEWDSVSLATVTP